jgi:hypothetical protein
VYKLDFFVGFIGDEQVHAHECNGYLWKGMVIIPKEWKQFSMSNAFDIPYYPLTKSSVLSFFIFYFYFYFIFWHK